MTEPDPRWSAKLQEMNELLDAAASEWSGRTRATSQPEASPGDSPGVPLAFPSPRRRSRWLWLLAPAAAIGGLLLVGRSAPTPAGPLLPVTASLEAEADRPFIVLETDNPSIAVVWLLEESS